MFVDKFIMKLPSNQPRQHEGKRGIQEDFLLNQNLFFQFVKQAVFELHGSATASV